MLKQWLLENIIDDDKLKFNWFMYNNRKLKKYPEIYTELKNIPGETFPEKIYIYINNLKNIPKCIICNKNNAIFKNFRDGYRTCSKECRKNPINSK